MPEMSKTFNKVFANATSIELRGNRPYCTKKSALYLVNEGVVDVFYIRSAGDLLALSSFSSGMVLPFPAGIQISGREGSFIKEIPLSELSRLDLSKSDLEVLLFQISKFNEQFIQQFVSEVPTGVSYQHTNIELDDGEILGGEESPALINVSGEANYCGQLLLERDSQVILSRSSWLTAINKIQISPIEADTQTLIAGISQLHSFILSILSHVEKQVDDDWFDRIASQSSSDKEVFQKTLSLLSGVMDSESSISLINDELASVCYEAASVKGITLNQDKLKVTKSVEAFAANFGLRCRRVRLDNKWYNSDAGVFIGMMSGRPVTLKPLSDNYYYAYAGGSYSKVTPSVAEQIEGFAWSIFDSLPDDKVKERDIFKLAWKEGHRDLVWVALLGIVIGLLGMATPAATGMIIGHVIPGGKYSMLLEFGLGLFVATVASSLFALVQGFSMMRFTSRSSFKLQSAVWDRLLSLPAAFFSRYDAGDLSSRALGIIAVKDIISNNLLSTMLGVTVGGFNVIVAAMYSWKLTLVVIGFAVVGSAAGLVLSLYQLRFQRKVQKVGGEIQGLVLQLITGISKIRVAGAEVRAFSRWSSLFAKQRKFSFGYSIFSQIFSMLFSLMPLVQTALIFYLIVSSDADDRLSTGSYMAFTAAAAQIGSAINSFSGTVIALIQALPQYERARPILHEKTEHSNNTLEAPSLNGDIELRGVSFGYDENSTILHDIDFKAEAGEFVAIVGSSGAGKSTVLRILLGLEKVSSGMVLFDELDISTLNVSSLRKQFGVVLQGVGIMQGSIFSNVCGAQNLSQEQVWDALAQAGLANEIIEMPMGIHTVLPQGGGVLSGGQQQRLMIARALASKPKMLFFDEATSALDNKLQAEVSANIEGLKLTRVVIAHRLSTIRNADKIYVFDKGRVAQVGSFDELLADTDGIFAQLCRRQVL